MPTSSSAIRVPAGGAVAVPSYTVDRMRLSARVRRTARAPARAGRHRRHDALRHLRGDAAERRATDRSLALRADARARARRDARPLPDRGLTRSRVAGARGSRRRRARRRLRLPPRASAACGCRTSPPRSGSTSARCVPVPDRRNRPRGDDGRRRLLARLRRTTAGWTCSPSTPTPSSTSPAWETPRRAAAERPLPQRRRDVHRRQPRARAPTSPCAERVRRGRLRRDGRTDLYVTTHASDGALLWNHGDGTVQRGRRRGGHRRRTAGMPARPSATSTATAGPTSFVAGYTNPNAPIPAPSGASPRTTAASATSCT